MTGLLPDNPQGVGDVYAHTRKQRCRGWRGSWSRLLCKLTILRKQSACIKNWECEKLRSTGREGFGGVELHYL